MIVCDSFNLPRYFHNISSTKDMKYNAFSEFIAFFIFNAFSHHANKRTFSKNDFFSINKGVF